MAKTTWHSIEAHEAVNQLGANPNTGLSSDQAAARLEEFGGIGYNPRCDGIAPVDTDNSKLEYKKETNMVSLKITL